MCSRRVVDCADLRRGPALLDSFMQCQAVPRILKGRAYASPGANNVV